MEVPFNNRQPLKLEKINRQPSNLATTSLIPQATATLKHQRTSTVGRCQSRLIL